MPQKASKGHKKQQKATESHKKRQLETVGDNWRQEERRVLRWLGGYWNIKEWGHFVVRCCTNFFALRLYGEGRFQMFVVPLRYHTGKVIFHG